MTQRHKADEIAHKKQDMFLRLGATTKFTCFWLVFQQQKSIINVWLSQKSKHNWLSDVFKHFKFILAFLCCLLYDMCLSCYIFMFNLLLIIVFWLFRVEYHKFKPQPLSRYNLYHYHFKSNQMISTHSF